MIGCGRTIKLVTIIAGVVGLGVLYMRNGCNNATLKLARTCSDGETPTSSPCHTNDFLIQLRPPGETNPELYASTVLP